MNKKELVARIAQSTGLLQAQVARALDSTILLIREELVANSKPPKALDSTIQMVPDSVVDAGKVKIPGLGTFYTTRRQARIGRNPRTGAEVRIKARTVPKFKFSKQFVEGINR